ncbi:homoprotocatechuate degradation operon regulator HpaR [Acidovorax cavernicola]|uniref:Homoprotocatechuate degradation operon regulator HpaR n=1 Tax=Acidovorax cavernicola TaxID=1675792 RepID=A0A9X8D569_9BURK|nr:homoprotocatechuate degradation operon regulator HpaR [Acidovorax cavernicola]RIX79632.1 homoprotocatechuate degradation operon regulator HpaR [Acidovorax cavernicola]
MPAATNTDQHLRNFSRSLPMALLRARESVMGRFRPMLRAHGLTEQKWRLLRAMAASDGKLRPIELSQMTCISMPSLSRLLKSLQALDLIKDSPHARDQRSTEFALTASGRALVRKVAPHSEKIYAEIERLVGAEETEHIYQLCERISQRLGAGDMDEAGED